MASDPGGSSGNYYQILDNSLSKRKLDTNNTHDFPDFHKYNKKPKTNLNISQAKFITIKPIIAEKPLSSYNVFLIEKALESITVEKPEKITFTRDGNLLILTKTQSQTNKFLKATTLSNLCAIKVELHPTLNISKGVIHCSSLINLSEKEIIEGLSGQHVVECKKITKFKDGKQINTPLHILSFHLHDVPSEVNIAWEKCKVNPYIPTPMQCKNCHRIGHTKKHCSSEAKCVVCSATEHDSPCESVKCINCDQSHKSNNRKCPTYVKRQAIIKHKTIHKCSYHEAVQQINQTSTNQSNTSPVESLDEAIAYKNKLKALLKNKINEIKQASETQQSTSSHSNSNSNQTNQASLYEKTDSTPSISSHSNPTSNNSNIASLNPKTLNPLKKLSSTKISNTTLSKLIKPSNTSPSDNFPNNNDNNYKSSFSPISDSSSDPVPMDSL